LPACLSACLPACLPACLLLVLFSALSTRGLSAARRPNGLYNVSSEGSGEGWWGTLLRRLGIGSNRGDPIVQLDIVRGDVVLEARQVFANWATLVTRWVAQCEQDLQLVQYAACTALLLA
jgi:hypothetical protein